MLPPYFGFRGFKGPWPDPLWWGGGGALKVACVRPETDTNRGLPLFSDFFSWLDNKPQGRIVGHVPWGEGAGQMDSHLAPIASTPLKSPQMFSEGCRWGSLKFPQIPSNPLKSSQTPSHPFKYSSRARVYGSLMATWSRLYC